jgi:hypothetical protein
MNGREEKNDNEGRQRNGGRKHGEAEEICHKPFAISTGYRHLLPNCPKFVLNKNVLHMRSCAA